LGNGLIGATFGAQGVATRDSRAYVAGVYDAQENLSAVPNWHTLALPPIPKGADYEQSLDMRRGLLVTRWDNVTVTTFVSAAQPNLAVIRVDNADVKLPPTINQSGVKVAFRKLKQLGANSWAIFAQVLRPTDKPILPEPTYQEALQAHQSVWEARWQDKDIVIDGDPEAQQLVHKLLFDLLQSTRVGGGDSIAPESLSSDFYKGHIFWDADVWMFPALLAQHPQLARNILDYRFKTLDQARKSAKTQGFAGADYPWESAKSGKETAPGGFSEGRHVTAGVGWSHWQYYLATGDRNWLEKRGWPVISAVAEYWASRVKKDDNGAYHIKKVTGPDELHMGVDDNSYTNAMALQCLRAGTAAAEALGKSAPAKWNEIINAMYFARDPNTGVYRRCAGDDGKPGTKQADGELLLWPARHPMSDDIATKTFDYHVKRPIKNGPAMTDSVHALINARLGRAKEAEVELRESYRPFVRGPFLLFSEKRSLDRCVFTTGAGGVLQSIYYGFGGLDWAGWNDVAAGKPTLPPSWKKLTITGIAYRGKRWTLTVTPKGKTLAVPGEEATPAPPPSPGPQMTVGRRRRRGGEDEEERPATRRRRRTRRVRSEESASSERVRETTRSDDEEAAPRRRRRRTRRRSSGSEGGGERRSSGSEGGGESSGGGRVEG
jgi:trehalose/maltose hydrolase-like predicted phosphorylase